ncbi:MAG: hypothetical protein WCO15_08190, partial [Actinomycetota bacterium]
FPTDNDVRSVWKILPESQKVCAVATAPQRLVALKAGICRAQIAPRYDPRPRTHTFTIRG